MLFLARIGELEFVASHQVQKSTISASTRYTDDSTKYHVFTASICHKAAYDDSCEKRSYDTQEKEPSVFAAIVLVPFLLIAGDNSGIITHILENISSSLQR